jgi:hypothetical protein
MSILSAVILCVIYGSAMAWFFVELKAPIRKPDEIELSRSQRFGCLWMLVLITTFLVSLFVK